MFWASICPALGEQQIELQHTLITTGCDGRSCVELGCSTRAASQIHTATAITTSVDHHMLQRTLMFS
jgi:hypothetical protein